MVVSISGYQKHEPLRIMSHCPSLNDQISKEMCEEIPRERLPKRTESSQGIHGTGSIAVQSGGATEAVDGTNARPPVWPGRSPQITTGSSSVHNLGFLFPSSSILKSVSFVFYLLRRNQSQTEHIYRRQNSDAAASQIQ